MGSADILTFGPDNALIVADTASGTIHTFHVATAGNGAPPETFNLKAADERVAEALAVSLRQLRINDMAIHPLTRQVFLAVTRGTGAEARGMIVAIDGEGVVQLPALTSLGQHQLNRLPDSARTTLSARPLATMVITTLGYHEGKLYVSGVNSTDFSSTLHQIAYPFTGMATESRIEIYHAVHDQNETRAPIRAQTIVGEGDDAVMIAAYTCTPIVTIPLRELTDGAQVRGKTIADVGYGNTPVGILSFKALNQQYQLEEMILVVNKQRSAQIFSKAQMLAADALGSHAMDPSGLVSRSLPLSGIVQIKEYSDTQLLALRRDAETGSLDLLSFGKGWYFRISDHFAEYEMPGFAWPADGSQEQMRQAQVQFMRQEGYGV